MPVLALEAALESEEAPALVLVPRQESSGQQVEHWKTAKLHQIRFLTEGQCPSFWFCCGLAFVFRFAQRSKRKAGLS